MMLRKKDVYSPSTENKFADKQSTTVLLASETLSAGVGILRAFEGAAPRDRCAEVLICKDSVALVQAQGLS